MQAIDPAELQSFQVPPGSLTLWWLGQAGFLLKSPAGTLVAVDPYLSNSCKAIGELIGMEMDRLVPPPLAAADLAGVDLYAITHSHGDHLDPETVAGYRKAGGEGPYLAPPETADKLRELGIPADQIVMTWPNKLYRARNLWIRATLAIPFGPDDLNHVGYIIGVDGGPCAVLDRRYRLPRRPGDRRRAAQAGCPCGSDQWGLSQPLCRGGRGWRGSSTWRWPSRATTTSSPTTPSHHSSFGRL